MTAKPIVPKILQLVSEKTGIQLNHGVHNGTFIECKDSKGRRYAIILRGSTCNPFIVTLIRETRKRRAFNWLIGGQANTNCTNVAYWGIEDWQYFATKEEVYQCLTENLMKDLEPEGVANYLMAVKSSWHHLEGFAQYFVTQYFGQKAGAIA